MNQAYQKLGELLLAGEIITPVQLEQALMLQETSGLRLGEVLVRHGFADEEAIANALGTQYGFQVIDPATVSPTLEALDLLTFGDAATQSLLPISVDSDSIFCLVVDPLNVPITDDLAVRTRKKIVLGVSPDTKLKARIVEAYRGEICSFVQSTPISLPDRFIRATPRYETNSVLWVDAQDSILERLVSLAIVPLDCPLQSGQLGNFVACAKYGDGSVVTVHDSIEFQTARITVLERLHGSQLAEILRMGKSYSPAEAAKVVSQVAKGCADLGLHDPKWICAQNVWLDADQVKLAPLFAVDDSVLFESDIEALGNLLWQCLIGRQDRPFEPNNVALSTIPSGMLMILQRCLSPGADRFQSAKEVYDALAKFKWASVQTVASSTTSLDRDELLATLRVVSDTSKKSIWQKLFNRRAA